MKKLAINPSNKKYYSDDYIKGWEDGVKAQYEATKDAVEVVRCKDCRHRDLFSCPLTDNDFQKDEDYCSWGERKGGDSDG